MQENPPQPQPQPEYVPQPPMTAPYTPPSDGRTLGIVGLVLGLLWLWPVGIVLSIISITQAKKAHASKTLGIVGLVFNILSIFVSGAIIAAITIVAYNGIQNRATTSTDHATANNVMKHAEAYYALSDPAEYPADIDAFETYTESSLTDTSSDPVPVAQGTNPETGFVTYIRCNDPQSAQVSYYNATASRAVILPLGNASGVIPCY